MGITAKSKATDNWGMGGFFLVFFPDDHQEEPPSTSSSKFSLRRSNSTAAILGKTQSTLLVCALLLFVSLVFFTISTFDPALPTTCRMFAGETETALQRMGKLHLRGTRAVHDLLVCHVPDDTSWDDFRVFLRVLFRSGFTSRADVVFLLTGLRFEGIVREESESFLKLLERYYSAEEWTRKKKKDDGLLLGFESGRFLRSGRKEEEVKEPLWGKKKKKVVMAGSNNDSDVSESTRPSYGSVVSFEASELDPENSLAGFLDHVPIGLRRWACYPMLLGRLRRNFKHVVLADAKSLLVLDDPLNGFKNLSGESVHVFRKSEGKPIKRNSAEATPLGRVNSAVLMGGARGVRRLSSYMLMGIVRAAMQQQQHRRKSPVTESGVLGQLVGSRQFLKNVNVVESAESIPELGSLEGLNSVWRDTHYYYSVIQRGNGNRQFNSDVMKRICACEIYFSVYKDCQLVLADNR